jgi:hypothetical protein
MAALASPLTADRPRSRRAILAGALGGLAGLVGGRLAAPEPAVGAAGSPLIVGSETNNAGTSDTQLIANSNVVTFKLYQQGPGTALMGYTTTASGLTRGVYGRVDSPNGDGIQGRNGAPSTGTGAAIRAYGGNNVGVRATSDTAVAVRGVSIADTGVSGHSNDWVGVGGTSVDGFAVWGESTNNYAGFFANHVYLGSWVDIAQVAVDPGPPVGDLGRLFIGDAGDGKSRLCVQFPSGAVQVLATEP